MNETGEVLIALCPEHGLHGERTECFVCGGAVEQIAMIPAATVLAENRRLKSALLGAHYLAEEGHARTILRQHLHNAVYEGGMLSV